MRDVFPEPGLLVHGLTLGVVDDGEGDLLQDGGEGSVCNDDQDVKMIPSHIYHPLYLHKAVPSQ